MYFHPEFFSGESSIADTSLLQWCEALSSISLCWGSLRAKFQVSRFYVFRCFLMNMGDDIDMWGSMVFDTFFFSGRPAQKWYRCSRFTTKFERISDISISSVPHFCCPALVHLMALQVSLLLQKFFAFQQPTHGAKHSPSALSLWVPSGKI